jgi:hypothetical protein
MTVWTTEMHDRLRELTSAAEILTYETIAGKLSVEFDVTLTKNACIGVARRLGISKRPAPSFANPGSDFEPKPKNPKRVPKFVFDPPDLAPPGPRNGLKTILELKPSSCRWTHGDHAPYLFCGRRTDGAPYCAEHHKIVYSRLKSR